MVLVLDLSFCYSCCEVKDRLSSHLNLPFFICYCGAVVCAVLAGGEHTNLTGGHLDVVTGGYGSRLSGGDNGQLAGLAVIGGFRERVANPNQAQPLRRQTLPEQAIALR